MNATLFPELYRRRPLDEPEYTLPGEFTPWQWCTVAHFDKEPSDGDGQPATVQECRGPARFWRVIACEDRNSLDTRKPEFTLSTGSGDAMGHLVFAIARAISEGMLCLDEPEATP
jgi:hypothetical protein